MSKQCKVSRIAFAISFAFAGTVSALETNLKQNKCDSSCQQQENSGSISTSNELVSSAIGENVERHLVRKNFNLHALSDAELEVLSPKLITKKEFETKDDSNLVFNSGLHSLSKSTLNEIHRIIELLKDKEQLKLHFVGHADNQKLSVNSQKIYGNNQGLSERRAQIIAEYFKSNLKLSSDAVSTEGKADRVPLASNSTMEGMAQNRRVEIVASYIETKSKSRIKQICAGEIEAVKGMRITVDGEPVSSHYRNKKLTGINNADQQRCADVALEKLDIQLQYDNLTTESKLNVSHALIKTENGLKLAFQGYSNYFHFIDKAELLIYPSANKKPLISIELNASLSGQWLIPEELIGETLSYQLRVYNNTAQNSSINVFDETSIVPLPVVEKLAIYDAKIINENSSAEEKAQFETELSESLLSGYGDSRLSKQNITVKGGSLTLSGINVPADHSIYFLGRKIPLSQEHSFVNKQILPAKVHRVEVAVLDNNGNGQLIYRDLDLNQNNWFYVGLADLTVGENSSNGPIELMTGDQQHYDGDLFVDGRLAFYAKGKWLDDYIITSSVDTREQPIGDVFSNFSAKDPASLFRRLEDENHFSVYGDDSKLEEDAPTKGKFYFKIEDDKSQLLWGNFRTQFDQTDLTRIERGLYGAQLDWNSKEATTFGEKQTQIDLFVAEADTSTTYEEQRGTGGSLYYLQHQDITSGSERVAIEYRDKDSDIVLSRIPLIAGSDYTIDSLQGRLLLARPLSSTSNDNLLIRDGGISGNPVFLVTNYEYTPGFEELDDLTIGGRVSHWISDSVKFGMTMSTQDIGEYKQKLAGVDLLYRYNENTYIKLEAAQSDGLATGAQRSSNGGYHFDAIESSNSPIKARASRIESSFSLTDFGLEKQGTGQFYWQQKEAGYNGLGQLTRYDTVQLGTNLSWPLTDSDNLNIKLDTRDEKGGIDKQSAELNLTHEFTDEWSFTLGVRKDETKSTNIAQISDIGLRTDVGVKLDYKKDTDWSAFLFAQDTIDSDVTRNENDRFGLGGRYQVSDKIALSGEISDGNLGFGSKIGADYQYSDASNLYLNYELDPDRTDNGIAGRNGQLVTGAKHRFTDSTSVYGEERYLHGQGQTGLTHAYGVDYSPTEHWTFGLALENGEMQQPDRTSIDRNAVSLSAGYASRNFKYAGAIEYREDAQITETRESWLTRNNFAYQVNPDWRTQLRVDVAISDNSGGNALNSDYTEALLGFAYRPVESDRFNAMLTYNFLEDLAPAEQFTASGVQNDYQQRSHVFAVDANYDLTSRWSIGGKYARRQGEIREGRDEGTWFESTADLYIIRADWHLVKHWDFLVEARRLEVNEIEERRSGALIALHRHIGEHVKLGVGYNFTDFSDDLTDMDYDAKGWFINLLGKF